MFSLSLPLYVMETSILDTQGLMPWDTKPSGFNPGCWAFKHSCVSTFQKWNQEFIPDGTPLGCILSNWSQLYPKTLKKNMLIFFTTLASISADNEYHIPNWFLCKCLGIAGMEEGSRQGVGWEAPKAPQALLGGWGSEQTNWEVLCISLTAD